MAEPTRTVAMIGVDAAELSFIQRHLAVLPRFRELLERGRLHRLRTTADDLTGSVWPTFYTGTLPGEHGIYHHLQWDAQAMRIRRVTADWLYAEPFWYQLEREGRRVAAIDVPMTFPSRLSRGTEIINWGSHDELGPFRTRPASLETEIRRRFGRHPMGSEIPVRKTPAQLEEIRRNLVAGAQRKSELTRWVLQQGPWDFFLTVFGETHRGGHILWPEAESEGEDALLDVYRAVDRAVGEVFDLLQQRFATVMLFALHGMGRNSSQEHFMPRIMDRVNAGFVAGNGPDAAGAPVHPAGKQRGLVRLLRERVPPAVQNAIARAVPVAVRDAVVSRQVSGGHDWGRTPGLALLADLNGYLRWNLRGRERLGMFAPGTAEQVGYIEGLVRALQDLRTDDGERLVSDVRFAGDDYPGGRSHHLPDAIVRWDGRPPVSRVRSDGLGEIRGEVGTGRGGNHRFEGFCVVVEIRPGAAENSGPRHIKDLAARARAGFAAEGTATP
jgi:predicted AlkP superfamily phosphohydrolase/phosphomutase